ncbi:MAG: sugar transferase [Pedosphaera parvula]|nr:sugar transferase [Pedosphaera parvula]
MLTRQREFRTKVHWLFDVVLFALGYWLAHWLRDRFPNAAFPNMAAIEPFYDYLRIYFLLPFAPWLLESQGYYDRPWSAGRRLTAWQVGRACAFAVIGVILVMFLLRIQLARSVIILFGAITFGLILLKEELRRLWLRSELGQAQSKKRFIVVGTAEDSTRLLKEVEERLSGNIEVPATLNLNETPVERLADLLHEHSANGVILSAKHTFFGQVEKAIQLCEIEGVEVWLLADFFNTQVSQTSVDDFCGRPTLVFRSVPEASWQIVGKQVIDFVGALVLLLLLALPMLGVAAAVRLTSPGPVLFRQRRSGLNGRPFMMFKFRSMVTNAEQLKDELAAFNEMTGPVFKVTNDPRVTPAGHWLRRYSIDELPQLWNVLRGEMSLVGPRPLPVDEVNRFHDLAHRRRLSVKPGLTCLWQISGRNEVKDFKDWVRLDLEYIDNWSLWLDMKILLRTIPVVLLGTGAK